MSSALAQRLEWQALQVGLVELEVPAALGAHLLASSVAIGRSGRRAAAVLVFRKLKESLVFSR